jgi:hypothetical protein
MQKHSIGYFKLEGETYNAQIRSADAGLQCSEWEEPLLESKESS